jgi:hypothetical protein
MGRLLGKVALTPAERSRRFRARKKHAAVVVPPVQVQEGPADVQAKLKRWKAEGKLAQPPEGAETIERNGVPYVVLRRTSPAFWVCPVTMGPCLPECEGMCARQLQALRVMAEERGQELVLVMRDEPGG